jgi:hypothetical protein
MDHPELRLIDLVQHGVETRIRNSEALETDVRQRVVPRHCRLRADTEEHALASSVGRELIGYIAQPPPNLDMRNCG